MLTTIKLHIYIFDRVKPNTTTASRRRNVDFYYYSNPYTSAQNKRQKKNQVLENKQVIYIVRERKNHSLHLEHLKGDNLIQSFV